MVKEKIPNSVSQPNNLEAMESRQRAVMSGVINLAEDGSFSTAPYVKAATKRTTLRSSATPNTNSNEVSWRTVTHRKKRNKTTLGENTSGLSIAAVESRRSIFISRLSPDTTPEMLRQHLVENDIEPSSIEKLDIKSSEIAAFRVVIQQSDEKRAVRGEIWPKYTIIRPFRRPRAFLQAPSQANQLK